MSEQPICIGDRVLVGTVGDHRGTVEGFDEPGLPPGVRVRFDYLINGVDNCYAAYSELTRVDDGERGGGEGNETVGELASTVPEVGDVTFRRDQFGTLWRIEMKGKWPREAATGESEV